MNRRGRNVLYTVVSKWTLRRRRFCFWKANWSNRITNHPEIVLAPSQDRTTSCPCPPVSKQRLSQADLAGFSPSTSIRFPRFFFSSTLSCATSSRRSRSRPTSRTWTLLEAKEGKRVMGTRSGPRSGGQFLQRRPRP